MKAGTFRASSRKAVTLGIGATFEDAISLYRESSLLMLTRILVRTLTTSSDLFITMGKC